MEVYWQLGRGFLEPVYQEAMEMELTKRLIPFESQKRLTIHYKGQPLTKELHRGPNPLCSDHC
jgi:GxxExxY protein